MAVAIEVNEADLRDYQQILKIFEDGDALGGFNGRIKELAKIYKSKHPAMPALARILAEVKYQDELAYKMKTFASDKDRSEGEVFNEQALVVAERIAGAVGKLGKLAIDEHTAAFLALEEGPQPTAELQTALSSRIRDYYLKLMRGVIGNGFNNGDSWEQIGAIANSLRTRLERIVPKVEADKVLLDIEDRIHKKTLAEQKIATSFSSASLVSPPTSLENLAKFVRHVESKGLDTGTVTLLSNGLNRTLDDLYAIFTGANMRRQGEDAVKWVQQLGNLKARSESAEWRLLLERQIALLTATEVAIEAISVAMQQLHQTCRNVDARIAPEHRSDWDNLGLDAEALRKSWGRLEQPLSKLEKWLLQYLESVKRLRGFVPRVPPAIDAATRAWSDWTKQAEKNLTDFLDECGGKDAGEKARDCINVTQRELSAWQIRQRTSADVITIIDSGAPWEQVVAAAVKVGESDVAGAIHKVMSLLQTTTGWEALVSVCDGLSPTGISLAMYTLSKSDKQVEKLASLFLDAVESGAALHSWFEPWLDAFGDDSPQWFVLLRHAELTQKVLNNPARSIDDLLALTTEDGRSAALLEAHRSIRGIREPDIDPVRFPGAASQRVRQLLSNMKRERERVEVQLEVRIAYYAALALVPLGEAVDGPRPRWGLRDASAWDAHLTPEWNALLKVSDELYWKVRALAPLSRRMGYKRELALLGLTETLHLSPGALEADTKGGSGEDLPVLPTTTEIITLVMSMERVAAAVTTSPEVLASVRSKLEQQLGHIGLGLLTLDLERPGAYGVGRANWISRKVLSGFGRIAPTKALLNRLQKTLADAEWVLKRVAALDGVHGELQAVLRESLDVARAAEAGTDAKLPRVLESLVSDEDGSTDTAKVAEVITEALALSGTQPISNHGSKILWEYAMFSIQEFVLRYTRNLNADKKQELLALLRKQVIGSPDLTELRRRLDRLAFLDANDGPTKALSSHIAANAGS